MLDEAPILACLDAADRDQAVTLLLSAMGSEILSYLIGVLHDEQAAREVLCECGTELWEALPTFRRECSLRTFCYRLAWHGALRHRRDPFRRRAVALTGPAEALVAEVVSRTAAHLRTEARQAVDRLREQLDPEEQTLLTLRIDRRLSWSEVAQVLSLPEATLRKRFERIKERLRQAAQREGLLGVG